MPWSALLILVCFSFETENLMGRLHVISCCASRSLENPTIKKEGEGVFY